MGFKLLINEAATVSPEEAHHVQLRVCGAARSVEEAREMLDFLGLLPAADEKPDKPEYYELCVRWKHRLTPENTVFGDRGGRKCRACRDDREPKPVVDETELCGNKLHYMTEANVRMVKGRGGRPTRRCIACQEEANRRHADKKRDSGRTTVALRGKVCVNGHPWVEGSFKVNAAGARSCLRCKA